MILIRGQWYWSSKWLSSSSSSSSSSCDIWPKRLVCVGLVSCFHAYFWLYPPGNFSISPWKLIVGKWNLCLKLPLFRGHANLWGVYFAVFCVLTSSLWQLLTTPSRAWSRQPRRGHSWLHAYPNPQGKQIHTKLIEILWWNMFELLVKFTLPQISVDSSYTLV